MSTTHLGILQDTSKDQHSNGRCITELIGRFWQHQLLLSFSEVRMLLLSCLRAEGCRFGKRASTLRLSMSSMRTIERSFGRHLKRANWGAQKTKQRGR